MTSNLMRRWEKMKNKLFVEVYQNGECVNVWKGQSLIVENLLFYFFTDKTINNKNFKIKKLKISNFNQSNDESLGTIEIDTWYYNCDNEKEITTIIFNNIPLKYGMLDTWKLHQLLEEEYKNKK